MTTHPTGLDLNKPRSRAVLAAATALSVAPDGFTVADLAAKVHAMTGTDYSVRQAAYDIKKLRAKQCCSNRSTAADTTSHPKRPAP